MPEHDPIRASLEAAIEAAGLELAALPHPPKESDLEKALRRALTANPDFQCDRAQRTVALAGWPGVGPVDIAGAPASGPVLVELKWGEGTLYNCAWDAPKLALALREGQGSRAFLIAGAPVEEFWAPKPGSGLLSGASWDTAALLDRHAAKYRKWRREVKTRPVRLPDCFETDQVADVGVTFGEVAWSLRCAEVTVSGDGWIDVDPEGVARPWVTGTAPTVEAIGHDAQIDQAATRLAGFEGGSVSLIGDSALLVDEGTMADFLPEDERALAGRSIYRFACEADLEAYAAGKGWLERPHGLPQPVALEFRLSGYSPDLPITLRWDFAELLVGRGGETTRTMVPTRQWRAFWERADELGVWDWRRLYTAEQFVTDALGWDLLIAGRGRLLSSGGYDAFPPAGDPGAATLQALFEPLGIDLLSEDF